MYELALCAGIGGISKGLRDTGHFRTICYVERNPYRVQVLQSRMADGYLDDAPIWDDVTTFDGKPWRRYVDILTAGFPCQPFSMSGTRKCQSDRRYLWPDIYRIICESRPSFILLENVPGLLMGNQQRTAPIADILADLAQSRYDCEWQCIPAAAFGAPHLRERIFIVAYSMQKRPYSIYSRSLPSRIRYSLWAKPERQAKVLDIPRYRLTQLEEGLGEPSVFGSNDGLSYWMERLEAVGETVCPAIAEYVGCCIVAAVQANQEVAS